MYVKSLYIPFTTKSINVWVLCCRTIQRRANKDCIHLEIFDEADEIKGIIQVSMPYFVVTLSHWVNNASYKTHAIIPLHPGTASWAMQPAHNNQIILWLGQETHKLKYVFVRLADWDDSRATGVKGHSEDIRSIWDFICFVISHF